MRKKIFAILMSALMMVSFMPAMAFADGEPVAKIGDIGYETLQEAIATVPANNTETATIELLKDITLNEIVDINKNNVVIDGNGKTIAADNTKTDWTKYKVGGNNQGYGNVNLISITGSNVTVKNVTIDVKDYRGMSCMTTKGGQNVTYENVKYQGRGCGHYYGYAGNGMVTFKNCVVNTKGYGIHLANEGTKEDKVIIDSCEVYGWNSFGTCESVTVTNSYFGNAWDGDGEVAKNGNLAVFRPYCQTTMTNCTFSKEYTLGKTTGYLYVGLGTGAATTVSLYNCSVENGTDITSIVNYDDAFDNEPAANGSVFIFDGSKNSDGKYIAGTFVTRNPSSIQLAEGYGSEAVEGKANTYTVVDNHVARIGDTKYLTLDAALATAMNLKATSWENGATIELLKDVEVEGGHTTAKSAYGALHLGKDYCGNYTTIDGNGHTIKLVSTEKANSKGCYTVSVSEGIVKLENLIVDANATIVNDDKNKSAINASNSTLICDNVTVKNTKGGWSAFNVNKSTVTLNECTVTDNVMQVISCDGGDATTSSIATINSGTYDGTIRVEGENAYNVLNVNGGMYTFGTINGELKIDCAEGGVIAITAGEFAADPHTFVVEGYKTYLLSDTTLATPYVVSSAEPSHSAGMNTWTLNAETGLYEESYVAPPTPVTPADDTIIPEKIEEATSIDVSKEVEVKKDESGVVAAKTEVSEKVAESIVEAAKENKSEEVVIAAVAETKPTENVTKAEVALPVKAIEELAKVETVQTVVIQTNVAEITLDKETAAAIAEQAPEGATIIVEAVREDEKSEEVAQDVYELKIIAVQSGTKTEIGDFKGGKVTVKVDIPEGLTGKKVACLYRDDNGKFTRRAVTNQDDANGFFSFTTNHFSDYIVTEESTAQKMLVNQTEENQKKLKANANGKIKVSFDKVTYDTELGKKVQTYQIYRSTKKNSGFKKVGTVTNKKKSTKTITYTNAKKLKKGKKYYYKVRGRVQLANGKYAYTQWSNVRYAKCKKTVK